MKSCHLDAVLHVMKIVAKFYKVQYKHTKRDVVGCVCVFFPNPPGHVPAKNWQNWMTFDKVITNITRVTFFYLEQCTEARQPASGRTRPLMRPMSWWPFYKRIPLERIKQSTSRKRRYDLRFFPRSVKTIWWTLVHLRNLDLWPMTLKFNKV